MEVDLDSLQAAFECIAKVNSAPITEVIWMRGAERVEVPADAVAEWEFIGLSTAEFARTHGLINDA